MTPVNSFGLQHLTPVLVVDHVEPCVRFWTERLGFTTENQVPGDDGRLVFASAKAGDIEVMYQTRASVLAERPDAADEIGGHSIVLFITVNDLDAVEKALSGVPVVKPRHDTFYGSTELYVKEPGGSVVGFAQFKKQ
ncbi:MAG TPA: VOC family protein [Vicinamibacterales bacterium]|nr:VOC family protein [Vicinamibacterales bacterium]